MTNIPYITGLPGQRKQECGSDSERYSLGEANVALLGVPYVGTCSSRHARWGPTIVRETLQLCTGIHKDFDMWDDVKLFDAGNLDVCWPSYEVTSKRLKKVIKKIKNENKDIFPIFIGGEHLISLPIVEALKPKTIIQFDAHSDLWELAYKTEEDANALPFAVEYSHATWAYHASKKAKLFQIGVPKYSAFDGHWGDFKNVKKHNVTILDITEDISKIKMERPIHLTIDIDAFSGSHIETGHPEGELEPKQVYKMLENIKCDSLDIVEIADDKIHSKTGWLAAELITRVLCARFNKKKK